MILTSRIQLNKQQLSFGIGLLFLCLIFPFVTTAQTSLSLSVSPTLFEMSANPGQQWSSTVRVINPNPYEIKVFADVVNFAPQGEAGQGKFVPLINEETNGQTVAEWISITTKEVVVPAEQTVEVPFTVQVPTDAPPGGHFAALLIGTKPPADMEGVVQVETSQIVTSLLFLRVSGEVIESGNIRSFRTTKRIQERPEVTFELRFENKGNVHIQPQGEIKIINMWGQERGVVPINRATLFGNVLPDSVRKYTFTWSGAWSFADMGRYKAVATLAYGDEQKQFATSEIAFWVIPWKILSTILILLVSFVLMFVWAIKLYIRKMLSMAGVTPDRVPAVMPNHPGTQRKRVLVSAPIEEGMLDLRGKWQHTEGWKDKSGAIFSFIKKYRIFFIVLVATIVFIGTIIWYIQLALVSDRAYEVRIDGLTEDVRISSEDSKYQEFRKDDSSTAVLIDETLPKISIVNRSGVQGLAAKLRIMLEGDGYEVVSMENDLDANEANTVIVYHTKWTDEALILSEKLDKALLSAYSDSEENLTDIIIYVGKNIENGVQ